MSNTIYLKRGQTLNLELQFLDTLGELVVIDNNWIITSSLKAINKCTESILLECVTQLDGTVKITRQTDDLTSPAYSADIIAKEDGNREITEVFYINLSDTITPLT